MKHDQHRLQALLLAIFWAPLQFLGRFDMMNLTLNSTLEEI